MRKLLLFVLFLAACTPVATTNTRPQATPPGAQAQAATLAPNGRAQRVVLLSFDGLGADALAAQTGLASFTRAANEGTTARVIPVNPTLTGTTHASMITGASPDRHGIVSNRFHLPGTPRTQQAVGMSTDPDVETLTEAARRQGKRVGCLPFPAMDARTPRRTCDFSLAWTTALARPRTIRLTRDDFRREWVPPTWSEQPRRRRSFSTPMRARLEWSVPQRVRADVDLVAYDTTDDRTTNYDSFAVEVHERELDIDARELDVDETGWFSVTRRGEDGLYGSWSKLLSAEPTLDSVTIYWGGIHRNDAQPAEFRQLIDDRVGFWPGEPDGDAGAEVFIEQSERLSGFLTRAQTLVINSVPFDLFLAYHPEIDEASHQYLGVNDRPIRAAWVSADHALNAIRSALDLSRDALIVTGDHGLGPIDTELRVNRLLAERGFAERWSAFASGNVVHLYRFAEPNDTSALAGMLTASGYFEQVAPKSASAHRNAGDIVAYAKTNVALSSSNNEPSVVRPDYHGQHGGLNTHRQFHTVMLATGAGVRRAALGEIAQTRIARYVAQLMGIEPPRAAE